MNYWLNVTVLCVILGAAAGAMTACEGAGEEQAPADIPEGMVWITGNGAERPGFLMDATELTTAAFGTFVDATGYVTEAEEFGWSGVNFPWGREMVPNGKYPGNWWQGPFPYEDQVLDGYPGIAPVKSFPPAGNGLYDISGNVWEWTATQKPATKESVIKGGSFLCSTSYCTGFDFKQRQFTPADSGLNHLGVRLVRGG